MRSTILVLLWLGAIRAAFGNQTHLVDSSLENRLLSRRVRALVFPDKAAILLTAALTKLILGGRPSGLQYSLEFDMYVPVPDTVEGWQPKILKRMKPKPTSKRRYDWSYTKRPESYHPYYAGPYRNAHYHSFQLDLRSCIKRAMCELRAKLNAGEDQGFLMEDLMRIVLTVPEEVTDDKYRHRMDIQDCSRFYAPSCPYNVLDFLAQSGAKL
uniref:GG11284 n=1 Tax=Drosophila erecta TaxID=7220 RepID=B3P746_DROER